MVNMDQQPPPVGKGASFAARVSREGRFRFLENPSGGVLVAPLFYVPAAIAADRTFLAVVAGVWVIGQVTGGILLLIGDDDFEDEAPLATGPALLAQIVGLAPWVAVMVTWSLWTTPALTGLVALLAIWGGMAVLISGGNGDTLGQRIRASTYRGVAIVTAGLFGFAGFIVGLILLIKALHSAS